MGELSKFNFSEPGIDKFMPVAQNRKSPPFTIFFFCAFWNEEATDGTYRNGMQHGVHFSREREKLSCMLSRSKVIGALIMTLSSPLPNGF